MYSEKLSDDIGLYQNLGYQVFSQFSSKESAKLLLILLQNFFYKRGFSPKNIWYKIIKASKILRQMNFVQVLV